MRRSFLVILMLLLACSFATAADYIAVDFNHGDPFFDGFPATVTFAMTYECDDPDPLPGTSNGFEFTATGGAVFDYTAGSFTKLHDTDWWAFGGLNVNESALIGSGLTVGQLFTGGPTAFPNIATGTVDEPWLSITFDNITGIGGQFCVDSAQVGSTGPWKFSGMTCGLGGAPDRPLFVDASGSDANHPICANVDELVCTEPDINVTPVGDELSANHCNGTSFQFAADPGADGLNPATIAGWSVLSGPGTIDASGNYSIAAQPTGSYAVEIEVLNSCGETDTYAFDVVFTNNAPSFVGCPVAKNASTESSTSIQLNATDTDPCDGLTFSLSNDGGFPGDVSVSPSGEFVWDPTAAAAGDYFFEATVEDGEGGSATCDIEITLIAGRPLDIVIEKEEGGTDYDFQGALQGKYYEVAIFLASFNPAAPDLEQDPENTGLGGFDFLVAYDASALTFIEAFPGQELVDNGWEYFTYRFGAFGNCTGVCPTGMLRIVAMAELNDGPNHPDYNVQAGAPVANEVGFTGELVSLKFYVTNDRTYECQFVPIYFWWFDCTDNVVSDPTGNKAYVADEVFNFFDWNTDVQDYGSTALNAASDGGNYLAVDSGLEFYFPQYGAWNCDVDNSDGKGAIPVIRFFNGGVDIICADDIDARGDLNLNNIANEIADAVLYTNYFIYGMSAFTVHAPGQVAASDVNADGRVLTVGDLVYLVRVITGDAVPFAKLSPFANSVEFVNTNGVVAANGVADMGAALFVFDVEGQADATLNVEGMKMNADMVNGQLRVIVWSDSRNSIPANADVITVSGNATLVEAAAADYYGNDLNVNLKDGILPTSFALKQNYPNPFNPSTAIVINLPEQSEYKIDIYNVAGQLVKSVSGNGVGEVTEVIDMSGQASGIYFYKATAGQYTDTKKMVLMK